MTLKMYTLREAAEVLRINHKTLEALFKRGEIRAARVGLGEKRKRLVFREEDLTAYVEAHLSPTKKPKA